MYKEKSVYDEQATAEALDLNLDTPDPRLDDAADLREYPPPEAIKERKVTKPGNCTLDHVCATPYTLCPSPNVPQDEDGVEWSPEGQELVLQDMVMMKTPDGGTFDLPMGSFIQNVKRMLGEEG
jgi:hypothetical protein